MTETLPHRVHLVGAVGLDTVPETYETLGRVLGDRLKRVPDGEPGGRRMWIAWQFPLLRANPYLEAVPPAPGQSVIFFPYVKLASGVDPKDLHVTVEFIAPVIKSEDELNASGALASIRYHDGSKGVLLYLKPWRPKYLPADVLAYWADHEDFPHQSTAEQFFEESQFESYRALGEQIAAQAFAGAENFAAGNRLRRVFDRAALAVRKAQPMPPGWQGPPPHRTE